MKGTRIVKISQVLAMIFYGIITEIALKYRRFSYAKELYMNQRWKIAITGILQKKR